MSLETSQFDRKAIINSLVKSKHGALDEYVTLGLEAVKNDPEFLAHLITWNLIKGEIRDSKVALPIVSLRGNGDREFSESAIASLMTLDPKNLVKAYNFNKKLSKEGKILVGGNRKLLISAINRYLEIREASPAWWVATAVQHRDSLKTLYAITHENFTERKAGSYSIQEILFDRKYPRNSVFEKISKLKDMTPAQAAGTIIQYGIPFQIAIGALGRKKKEYQENPEFLLALMGEMSGSQLINSTKFLTSLGVFDSPMLKTEYNKAIDRAKKDKKVPSLKANKAISDFQDKIPEEIVKKLTEVQEVKIAQKTIDGDWLILGDCSGSMNVSIEKAREIASYITKSVAGKVYLIFFNYEPRMFDVTNMTLDQIQHVTRGIRASGGTSCGCGLKMLLDKNISVNGIAIVSDGGDNRDPFFHDTYKVYTKKMDTEPSIYFFSVPGDPDVLSLYCQRSGIHIEKMDVFSVDYYSLPNIISMMKTSRYGLIDEIMNTPLLTLNEVFK